MKRKSIPDRAVSSALVVNFEDAGDGHFRTKAPKLDPSSAAEYWLYAQECWCIPDGQTPQEFAIWALKNLPAGMVILIVERWPDGNVAGGGAFQLPLDGFTEVRELWPGLFRLHTPPRAT